ncbi:MAG: AAA family ATPase, partial [Bacteroidota bacterium]
MNTDEHNELPEETPPIPTPPPPSPADWQSNRLDLSVVTDTVDRIRAELQKVIIGQHETVDLLLAGLFTSGHVLIEGVPGIAKTLTAKLLAQTMEAGFSRIQFTPDLMPTDVVGTTVFNLKTSEFSFSQGPIFSNIILIDEINRSPAKTQAALFEVMEEYQVTMDGTTYPMDFPFFVVATQNPIEQEGTYKLPEAQLDRFMFMVRVDYPTEAEELAIVKQTTADITTEVTPQLNAEDLQELA